MLTFVRWFFSIDWDDCIFTCLLSKIKLHHFLKCLKIGGSLFVSSFKNCFVYVDSFFNVKLIFYSWTKPSLVMMYYAFSHSRYKFLTINSKHEIRMTWKNIHLRSGKRSWKWVTKIAKRLENKVWRSFLESKKL